MNHTPAFHSAVLVYFILCVYKSRVVPKARVIVDDNSHVLAKINIMSFLYLVDDFAYWNSISYQPINPFKRQSSVCVCMCARGRLKGFGDRSFSVPAPLVWNNLPAHIPHYSSLSQVTTSPV